MLLPREKKILELLYSNKSELTTTELANILHISSRTVKADVKRIREELQATGCMIQTKTGKGMWMSYNNEGKQFLDNLLLNEENASSIVPETRKYYIALRLLDADDYISMESISLEMYVSKGTIVNDVNRLQTFFEKQGLTLDKKVKFGIRVIGSESQLRIAKVNIIRKIVVAQGTQVSRKLQPFFADINLEKMNKILQDAEEKFEFILSDASYSELLTHLSIIVIRIRKGKRCATLKDELKECIESEEWPICEYIAQQLEEEFGTSLLDGDKSYIYMNLSAAKRQRDSVPYTTDPMRLRKTSPQTFDTWERIVEKVGEMYHENLLEDNTFKCALFVHLNAMFKRLRNQIHLENPLKRMIKEDLAYEFEVAAYTAGLLYTEYNIELGEDEICDIALYVGASLEREKAQRKVENPIVTVVCGTGMGTSQFIEAKLKLMFPDMIIQKILPISRVDAELNQSTQDFVISTVPLEIEAIKVINITPMLNDKDIRKIEEVMNPEIVKKTKTSNGRYSAVFKQMNDKISILKCDCRSKEEVIQLLGARMYSEGYVDEGFVESVFQRENLAPTSIGDTFAIPHAYEGHVLKQGIGLMTLKRPIMWGSEKVQIILMLSIDVKLKESFRVIFNELANITKDNTAVDQIINADKFVDIGKVFK